MNYNKIYASIVLRAQAERTERLALKKQGQYFENHHIIPRSLGGKNNKCNMALLTAREHFICHWLLVKIYPIGSNEHNKMLCALWRMRVSNDFHHRYIFSGIYAKMREEYAKYIGITNATRQCGNKNANYGNKWYTNYSTGESKLFACQPADKHWVIGRNIYNGQTQSILYLYDGNGLSAPPKYLANSHRKRPIIHQHEKNERAIRHAQELWDDYHSSDSKSVSDFSRNKNVHRTYIRNVFKKFIPIFSTCTIHGKAFKPDKGLVGIYEWYNPQ